MNKKIASVSIAFSILTLGLASQVTAGTLFQENFEDANFSTRGWYDNTTPRLSSIERTLNSAQSLEFRYPTGSTLPVNGGSMRKKITPSDSVYISYYVKYSTNWVGSGMAFHPHEFYLMTNKDADWVGPAYTYLTYYLEQNAGRPQMGIQDGVNVDKSRIGQNLVTITESRGVGGCNGDSDGYGNGDCYASGGVYRNGKMWKGNSVLFSNNQGPYYKSDWHRVEAYIKLNSIVNGKGAKDGIMQYWFDGVPIMDYRNVVLRTAINADMKFNQFMIGPYMESSPVDQTFWIDNLVVATDRAAGTPSAPQNVRVTAQ